MWSMMKKKKMKNEESNVKKGERQRKEDYGRYVFTKDSTREKI